VIQTFPGARLVEQVTLLGTLNHRLSCEATHIHCIPLLGTLNELWTGITTTVATMKMGHVQVMREHHLELENAEEDNISYNALYFTLTDQFISEM
jgi:hypothetical protein